MIQTARAVETATRVIVNATSLGGVTSVIEGRPFEVTTLREDVETYGRHAKVAFGRDWRYPITSAWNDWAGVEMVEKGSGPFSAGKGT